MAAAVSLLFLAVAASISGAESIQPYLAHLRLGDSFKSVQRVYPPAMGQSWPSYVEPRGRVERYRVERSYLRKPDPRVETMWLGFKSGRLVEIQLIYDAAQTRAQSVDKLATEWSLIYGTPQRGDDGSYLWADGGRVLRVFPAEVAVLDSDTTPMPAEAQPGKRVELRTAVQLIEQGVWERID